MAELHLDTVSHTLGILGQDLAVDLAGTGFDANTRVSMALDIGNTKTIIGQLKTATDTRDIALSGTTAFIAGYLATYGGNRGLLTVDVSDPTNPLTLGTVFFAEWSNRVDSITLSGTTAYVTVENDGLQIIDVSNPANPAIIGSVPISGINLLHHERPVISGTTVYLPGPEGAIIDVSDPNNPDVLNSGALRGSTAVAISGNTAYVSKTGILALMDVSNPARIPEIDSAPVPSGGEIVIVDDKAYIAAFENGLQIVDIDPSSPDYLTVIGSVDTSGWASRVVVEGTTAYVADREGGLKIINISNPGAPEIIGEVMTSYMAFGVAISGTTAYVADLMGGLEILDVSDPSTTIAPWQAGNGGGRSVLLMDDIAYLSSGCYEAGIELIDVSSPEAPSVIGSVGNIGCPRGLKAVGSTVYVVTEFNGAEGGFWVLDAADPANPVIRGHLDPGVDSRFNDYFAVSGTMAYIGKYNSANGIQSLVVVDVSDPMHPHARGSLELPSFELGDIAVSGDTIYITGESDTNQDDNFWVVNVSDPDIPVLSGSNYVYCAGQGVTIKDSIAYVADRCQHLRLVDISEPANPLLISSIYVLGDPRKVVLNGNLAYIVNFFSSTGRDDLVVVDLEDTANPVIIGRVNLPGGNAWDLAVSGPLAYVANHNAGLVIVPLPIEINPVALNSDTSVSLSLPFPAGVGNYALRVFNSTESSELLGAVTFTDNPDLLTTKAIIIAGTKEAILANDPVWSDTKAYADQAYENLRYQGYAPEDILYLSADAAGDCSSIATSTAEGADCEATLANLEYAVKTWAMNDPDSKDLLLYMVDHGGKDTFHVNAAEILTARNLDTWLDYLQSNMPDADPSDDFKVINVYDACESGSFISHMSPPGNKTRITMASSSANQPAYFLDTTHSFSYHFWSTLSGKSGDRAKPSEAFQKGAERMRGYQTALLDANGNGFPNEQEDFEALADMESTIYALRRQYNNKDMGKPVIAIVTDNQTLNGGTSANLMARSVYDIDGDAVTRVWAEILPPDADPDPTQPQTYTDYIDTIELLDLDDDGIYEGTYNSFTAAGTYLITYFAVDEKGIYSLPKTSLVTQFSGTVSPPDSYEGDDTYQEAGVIVPNDPTPQFHTFHDEIDDFDWVKFYAVAGKTYKIRTFNLSPITGTGIRLFDTDGLTQPPIAEHSDPAGYISVNKGRGQEDYLIWKCLYSGIYYVRIQSNNQNFGAIVHYELQIYEPTADFFTQGQVEGNVRSEVDNAIITTGAIRTTGAYGMVQENGTYIMWLDPGTYTLTSDIPGYVNEDYAPDITVTEGAVLTGKDFYLLGSGDSDGDGDGYTIAAGDCDDTRAYVHPGAVETPANGEDQNCDGIELCFADADDDGYRPNSTSTVTSTNLTCTDSFEAVSTDPVGDCNDGNANIHPGASDAICDGIDNDCVNGPDDGYVTTPTLCGTGACSAFGQWECQGGVETNTCTPGSPTEEICGDGTDQDCDGSDLICPDSDGDGLPDEWEQFYFSNLDQTGSGDPDGDKLINSDEYLLGTNPTNPDTDNDGVNDGREVQCNSDPVDASSKCSLGLPWLMILLE